MATDVESHLAKSFSTQIDDSNRLVGFTDNVISSEKLFAAAESRVT